MASTCCASWIPGTQYPLSRWARAKAAEEQWPALNLSFPVDYPWALGQFLMRTLGTATALTPQNCTSCTWRCCLVSIRPGREHATHMFLHGAAGIGPAGTLSCAGSLEEAPGFLNYSRLPKKACWGQKLGLCKHLNKK